jgi:hypothetical protein
MKKFFVIILCAIALGGGISYFLFNKIVLIDEDDNLLVAKAFQIGVFSNYDNALRVADRNNGIVIEDDDLFRVFVAVLYDQTAINKLSSYYDEIGLNFYLKEVSVSDSFIKSISVNEDLLINSSSDTYSVINLNVLEMYEEML